MFGSTRHEDTSLLKKATGAYLAYKALPFGSSSKKKNSGMTKKLLGGYVAMKVVPKAIKWIGGGALLAYALNYAYSKYNSRQLDSVRDDNF